MSYDGFSISCGCYCVICGSAMLLVGYCFAEGEHYCPVCQVPRFNDRACAERTPDKVRARAATIVTPPGDCDPYMGWPLNWDPSKAKIPPPVGQG